MERGPEGRGEGGSGKREGKGNLLRLLHQLEARQRLHAWKEETEARSSRRSIRRDHMARSEGQHRASPQQAQQRR